MKLLQWLRARSAFLAALMLAFAPLIWIESLLPATSAPSVTVTPLSRERERALKPNDKFRECTKCPEMIVAPAGSFMMGSPANELHRQLDEGPQHEVTFARPFAVGRFAVTFDEWDACVADRGCRGYKPSDEGWGRGRLPVINLSWYNAKTYVAWLSKRTGKNYRLLTEAEREYVTRAGTTTPFWWGSSISTNQANYKPVLDREQSSLVDDENRARTVAVDSFAPNPWGLYQVHGNVSEWVEDCYNDNYQRAPADGSSWISGNCGRRIVRGGNWGLYPDYLRSAARALGFTDYDLRGIASFGLRVGRTLTP